MTINVENFDEKQKALFIGMQRVRKCQESLDKHVKIDFVAGSTKEPVSMVNIEGILQIDEILKIYKLLKGEQP